MKFKDYLKMDENEKHISHLEDSVWLKGIKGAYETIDYLEKIVEEIGAHDSTGVSIKIDGCVHEDTEIITEVNGEIVSTKIKDYINSKDSYKILTHNFDTNEDVFSKNIKHPAVDGNKKWIEITTENDEVLKLTEDHEVYTQRGWVQSKDLTTEDDIKDINGL